MSYLVMVYMQLNNFTICKKLIIYIKKASLDKQHWQMHTSNLTPTFFDGCFFGSTCGGGKSVYNKKELRDSIS